jgi:ketosteroid isomerase-like protein
MKFLFLMLFAMAALTLSAQKGEEGKIRSILHAQTNSWNNGNIDEFMQPYWKSDSLMFVGKNGVTRGWKATLENYKKNYPDTASMGKLSFDLLEFKQLSPQYYFVVGKWMLKRSIGDVGGHFTLIWRKIKGRWVIVSDHSS